MTLTTATLTIILAVLVPMFALWRDTKGDIRDLRNEIRDLRNETHAGFAGVHTELYDLTLRVGRLEGRDQHAA